MTIESLDHFDRFDALGESYEDPLRDELVDLLRATASVDVREGPRPHVWAHIEAAITADDPSDEAAAPIALPTPLTSARRRRARRTITRVAAIAAAVSIVGGAAFAALGPLQGDDTTTTPAPDTSDVAVPSVEEAARRAAAHDQAKIVQLTGEDGTSVDVVVLPDGRAYVLDSKLPDADVPYLLYAVVGETRVLLGRLLGDGAVRLDRIPAGAFLVALVDQAGAVVAGATLAVLEAVPDPGALAPEPAPVPEPAKDGGGGGSAPAPAPSPPSAAPDFVPVPTPPELPPPPPPPPPGITIDLPLLPPLHIPLFG